MPNSNRFLKLQGRILELEKHFLPRSFNSTGSYTPRQRDRTRAFQLLAHAEIESYLEDIVVETANAAFESWNESGRVTDPLVALATLDQSSRMAIPKSQPSERERFLTLQLRRIKDAFNGEAKGRNNGIREKDVLRLLLPVGVSEDDLDPNWLHTIDAFGRDRGLTAHTTGTGIVNLPDPKDEQQSVKAILKGLSTIDERLFCLRNSK